MPYWTKKEMVRRAHQLLAEEGWHVSESLINRAFTHHGRRGNKKGSRKLFGCLNQATPEEMILALRWRGVVFQGRQAIGFVPRPPRPPQSPCLPRQAQTPPPPKLLLLPDFGGGHCPHCGAYDPLREQASICPHCDQPVE